MLGWLEPAADLQVCGGFVHFKGVAVDRKPSIYDVGCVVNAASGEGLGYKRNASAFLLFHSVRSPEASEERDLLGNAGKQFQCANSDLKSVDRHT